MHCINRLPVTSFRNHANNPVEKDLLGTNAHHRQLASYLYFSKDSVLQHIVHELKYKGNKELGAFIGRKMGEALLYAQRFKDVNALVPLPLFAARKKTRL